MKISQVFGQCSTVQKCCVFFETRNSGDEIRRLVQSFALSIDSFAPIPVNSLWTHFKISYCTILCLSNMSKCLPKVFVPLKAGASVHVQYQTFFGEYTDKNICKVTYKSSTLSRTYLLFFHALSFEVNRLFGGHVNLICVIWMEISA